MIRTLLVDDENLIRQTLKIYLKSEPNIEVVGTANNGKDAIALAENLEPDVVVIDIEMPEMDGLAAAETLRQRFSKIKIIILSNHNNSAYLNRALQIGVTGYLLKSLSPEELSQSIRLANRGYLQVAPGLSHKLSLSETSQNDFLSITEIATIDNSIFIQESENSRLVIGYNSISVPSDVNSLPLVEADEFLPPVSRWTTRGATILLGMFAISLLLTSVLKYKTTVKAAAEIRPGGELRIVQAGVEGTVTNIKVKANQAVRQGDIIATIDPAAWHTQTVQLQQKLQQDKVQLIQTKAQIAELDNQIELETKALEQIVAFAQADLNFNQTDYQQQTTSTQAELEAANAAAQLATEQFARYQQLAKAGVVSQSQIEEKKAALQEALARQKQAQAAIAPSDANITKATAQIAREQAQGEAQISELNRERQTLIEKQISLARQIVSDRAELQQVQNNLNKTMIRASASGIVQQLNLRNSGQVVSNGEKVATIAPSDSSLIVTAGVAPQDIGKVKTGQNVQIKVSACPYPDYGILTGEIESISPDVFESRSPDRNSSYQVIIKPHRNFVGTSERKCIVKPGMNSNAAIITQEDSVLNFILQKVRLLAEF